MFFVLRSSMGSLRDALVQAGLADKNAKKKQEEKRSKPVENQSSKKVHSHQEHRTICENCDKGYPDVEKYLHRSPVVKGQWLCLNCADEFMIPDTFRATAQSEYARRKIFVRRFGRTNKGQLAKEDSREGDNSKERDRKPHHRNSK